MKILPLFPPTYKYLTQPYLSLPSLTAFLRSKGCEVIQRDVNMEIYDLFLSKPELERAYKIVSYEFKKMQAISDERAWTDKDKLRYRIFKAYYIAGTYIIEEVENAKKVMRSEDLYNFNWLLKSVKILTAAMGLISAPYYPANLALLYDSRTDLLYSYESTEEVMKAAYDRTSNMFIDIYERYTVPSILEQTPDVILWRQYKVGS